MNDLFDVFFWSINDHHGKYLYRKYRGLTVIVWQVGRKDLSVTFEKTIYYQRLILAMRVKNFFFHL
jgi:hypothetical protein